MQSAACRPAEACVEEQNSRIGVQCSYIFSSSGPLVSRIVCVQDDGMEEARMVMTGAVEGLLKRQGAWLCTHR